MTKQVGVSNELQYLTCEENMIINKFHGWRTYTSAPDVISFLKPFICSEGWSS